MLSQLEKDLANYAMERISKTIQDIAQSWEIAGKAKAESLYAIAPICMRISAQIAVSTGMSREYWLDRCAYTYDETVKREAKGD